MNIVPYKNPYKGPFTFSSGDEYSFFGRKSETEELITLIRKNKLTVLFGSSGTGKTSLINAKLLPQLRREYFHPIYIRINFANESEPPLSFVKRRIVEELKLWDAGTPFFSPAQTLVDYAANNVIYKGLIKPVLFFDQFEEIFTLGPLIKDPKKIKELIDELANLIELRLPDELKTLYHVDNINNFKVVLSLRQDWVGYLDDYSDQVPSILENRYRLRKFDFSQAMDAIVGPAEGVITKETAKEIIKDIGNRALFRNLRNNLKEEKDIELLNMEVDPFVLSLYCYQLYEKAHKTGIENINEEFVRSNHNTQLIRDYYEEKMRGHEAFKILIETKLLNESGKRLILPLLHFVNGDKEVEDTVIKIADTTGILRVTGMDEKSEIEIVHDRLASEIKASRAERINRELNEEARRKNKEAEKLKTEAEKKTKEADEFRKKALRSRRNLSIVVVAGVIIVAAVLLAAWYESQRIIHEAQGNYTITGLQAQLKDRDTTIYYLQDSIEKIGLLKNGLATTGKFNDTAKERVIAQYNLLQTRYDSLQSADKTKIQELSDALETKHTDESVVNRVVETSNILQKRDSMGTEVGLQVPKSENLKLDSANIQVAEFCPIGLKSSYANYDLALVKYPGIISLKFKIVNFSIKNSKDILNIKIIYPVLHKGKPETEISRYEYGVNKPISIELGKESEIPIKFASGTYKYEIFCKGELLKTSSFEAQ